MNKTTNSKSPLKCIAHRGGESPFTENTANCIRHALDHNSPCAVEIDVWKAGNSLIVTHDRELGLTLEGNGRLLDQGETQISSLITKQGEKVARLEEILKITANRCELNIELKGPDCVDSVIRLLRQFVSDHQLSFEQYWLSSFDHHQLYQAKKSIPELKRSPLIACAPLDYGQCCEELEAFALTSNINFTSKELTADLHKRGLQSLVYTANLTEDFEDLSAIGVSGVFTDFPDRLNQWNAKKPS